MGGVEVDLEGVPETLLWTLYHRAAEARRGDTVLEDPQAVALMERIDHPFEARFGTARLGQWQALRASCFDGEVRRFETARPGGTVVALGEGLETQFWRVDDGRVHWVSVDVPEVIALRRALLPAVPRGRAVAASALDPGWMDGLDPETTLVTAQGLLMYFERDEVHGLLREMARRLPGATLVFDTAPEWLAERSRSAGITTATGYRPPPWRWGLDAGEERAIAGEVAALEPLSIPRGRGAVHGLVLPLANRVGPARRLMLSVFRARL
jgi:O-methyltransferase involved in polyketide biosynthesis